MELLKPKMALRDYLFYEEPGVTLYCGDLTTKSVQTTDHLKVRFSSSDYGRIESPRTHSTRNGSCFLLRPRFREPKRQQRIGLPCFDSQPWVKRPDALFGFFIGDDPIEHRTPCFTGTLASLETPAPQLMKQINRLPACLTDADTLAKGNTLREVFIRRMPSNSNEAIGVKHASKVGQQFAHGNILPR